MSHSNQSPLRVAEYVDVSCWQTAQKAERGHPGALREILRDTEAFLRGEKEIQPRYQYFVADALKALTTDSDLWEEAEEEFHQLDRSQVPVVEVLVNRGPRVSSKTQNKIGRAFNRAFHVARPQGQLKKGEIPKDRALCPPEIEKVDFLRHYGVSRRDAIQIVHSATPSLSPSFIDGWVRFMEFSAPKPGTGSGFRLIRNQCRMAAAVLRERSRGVAHEEAILRVANMIACARYPSSRAQMAEWARRRIESSREGTADNSGEVELAQSVAQAIEDDECLPAIPEGLIDQVLSNLPPRTATRLPRPSVELLAKAVSKAWRHNKKLRRAWPRWDQIWNYLGRRCLRLANRERSQEVCEQFRDN